MQKLELWDMQGLIARSYNQLPAAAYVLLQVDDGAKAKEYLQQLLRDNRVTTAEKSPPMNDHLDIARNEVALQIAFSAAGLRKMDLGEEILATFSIEFLDGMEDPIRAKFLGDEGRNASGNWVWGGQGKPVDILLLVYAINEERLEEELTLQQKRYNKNGITWIKTLPTYINVPKREHFGFRDGISSPVMEGLSGAAIAEDPIKAGEFVLGYKNEYNSFTDSPKVPGTKDGSQLLEDHPDTGYKDLGRNGTYLVFRQLQQEVVKFWQYLKDNSKEPGEDPHARAIRLGAKMVGRWPGGQPLVVADYDQQVVAPIAAFNYEQDAEGLKCPFGAHIRRSNPRDEVFSGRHQSTSVQMTRKHHLLRRGRIYGKPLVESMDPKEMLGITEDDGEARGLYFICLVGHISKQFEFVQNTWINNPAFANMCGATDPLVAAEQDPPCNEFTCQAEPVNRHYNNIPSFTRLMGGGYFFLPGIQALHFIAGLETASRPAVPGTNSTEADKLDIEEEKMAEQIIHFFKMRLLNAPAAERRLRGFHAKSIGLVKATLVVNEALPAELKIGLFAPGKEKYDAWVRFSNGSDKLSPDYKKSVRGMAIKIVGTGKPPLETDTLGETQDILLTNNDFLFPGKAGQQLSGLKVALGTGWQRLINIPALLLTCQFKAIFKFLKGRIIIANVLEQHYHSATPYCFGNDLVGKWRARPLKKPDSRVPAAPGINFLRERLKQDVGEKAQVFKLDIQLHKNEKQAVDDAAIRWTTPFIEVGTITIHQQDITEYSKLEEAMDFSPWHSMETHRPHGSVNRIRRQVYRQLSLFRRQ